jgi:hypothetical protein
MERLADNKGGTMTDVEEIQYLNGVLKHLRDLTQRTPKEDPVWQYALAAADAVFELIEMLRP